MLDLETACHLRVNNAVLQKVLIGTETGFLTCEATNTPLRAEARHAGVIQIQIASEGARVYTALTAPSACVWTQAPSLLAPRADELRLQGPDAPQASRHPEQT